MTLQAETRDRQRTMLRTAMGPFIAEALADPKVVEVMVNPDGRLWLDRLGDGRSDTGQQLAPTDVERIIRLARYGTVRIMALETLCEELLASLVSRHYAAATA